MKMMETLTTATRVLPFKRDCEKYRRSHEAKSKIPMDLPPAEYEAEVKRLARRFKI